MEFEPLVIKIEQELVLDVPRCDRSRLADTIDYVRYNAKNIWRAKRLGDREKLRREITTFLEDLSTIWSVESVGVRFWRMSSVFGCYSNNTNTIYVPRKVGVLTLLHEFAHHLQACGKLKDPGESGAWNFSQYVFFKAFPHKAKTLKPQILDLKRKMVVWRKE